MVDTTSIKCETFGDMVSIVANRGQIAGEVQDRDLTFIKGCLNENYITIATERNWYWRKMDRDFTFQLGITTGTVAVTQGSRQVQFTGLTVTKTLVGKSFKTNGTGTLYRIVGVDEANNYAFLSANYAEDTNATAQYKIYTYEMPLPPDCDNIIQVYYDFPINGYSAGFRQVEIVSNLEFNRALANNIDYRSVPLICTRDGKISAETLPPLDVMLLDYDFIDGDVYTQVDKIRFFPIEPDVTRVLHMNYAMHIVPMADDNDTPLMPIDNRWLLVNLTLADWFRARGQNATADRYLQTANNKLREMRDEYKKSDAAPKLKNPLSRYTRARYYNSYRDLLWISRLGEY